MFVSGQYFSYLWVANTFQFISVSGQYCTDWIYNWYRTIWNLAVIINCAKFRIDRFGGFLIFGELIGGPRGSPIGKHYGPHQTGMRHVHTAALWWTVASSIFFKQCWVTLLTGTIWHHGPQRYAVHQRLVRRRHCTVRYFTQCDNVNDTSWSTCCYRLLQSITSCKR